MVVPIRSVVVTVVVAVLSVVTVVVAVLSECLGVATVLLSLWLCQF